MILNVDLVDACAAAFIGEFGIDCRNRLPEVASAIGIEIVEQDAESYEGALLRVTGSHLGTIVLSTRISEPTRRLFTLCHEIGHYILPNQQAALQPCRTKDIESWGATVPETEANRFAAEVLMPRAEIAPFLAAVPSFNTIRTVANQCGVSLTAAAYRLVEMTSHRAAVVWSSDGKVEWYKRSEEFGRAIRKEDLDPRTYAADWFRDRALSETAESVPASAWLYEGNLAEDALVVEHSVALLSYRAVLSLIVIPTRIERHTEYDDSWEED